jgi:hypothetical protein
MALRLIYYASNLFINANTVTRPFMISYLGSSIAWQTTLHDTWNGPTTKFSHTLTPSIHRKEHGAYATFGPK